MKTQEQIQEEIKTLDEMGNTKMVRWICTKPDPNGEWKSYNHIPLEEAKKMITYCIYSRIDFSVNFEHTMED